MYRLTMNNLTGLLVWAGKEGSHSEHTWALHSQQLN